MSLDLIPNETVGYRFRADWHSINVVVVKRRGPNSKNAGQEYEETLAYCRNIESAALWLFHHVIRAQGAEAQAAEQAVSGSLADITALMAVVEAAKGHVLAAGQELQATFAALGLSQKELVKEQGGQTTSVATHQAA